MINKLTFLRKSNKGVTLIELIVTILIMSIVIGCVGLFISASRNSYFRINNETEKRLRIIHLHTQHFKLPDRTT